MSNDLLEAQEPEVETKAWKTRRKKDRSIFDPSIVNRAILDSFKKLDPRWQLKNPVMFVVEVGSVITSIEFVRLLFFTSPTKSLSAGQLSSETIFVLAVAV